MDIRIGRNLSYLKVGSEPYWKQTQHGLYIRRRKYILSTSHDQKTDEDYHDQKTDEGALYQTE